MRKIDKTKILSSHYKEWEEQFEQNQQNHGVYNSSNNPHYVDVVMNLLHVQGGLCAYTEMKLCNTVLLEDGNWKNGKYTNRNPEILGQLDHFNPALKTGKAWLWDNFFFIHTDINTKVKGKKEVDDILKPDKPDYDVEQLLEYDSESHIFIPHSELDNDTQERIKKMILTLGINFDPVIDSRKKYLENNLLLKKFGLEYEINEFPTAFEMISNNLSN